ncbi:MAG: DNA-binding protein [Rhizobiales bacterium]|nr:DNA-binding protein [Hyphomicrobiales bacterium]
MARIHPRLIERLAGKLGVNPKAVYPHIQRVAAETLLDRHLAALVLASRKGISINQYSTQQERAEIRGAHAGGVRSNAERISGPSEPPARTRKERKGKSQKTKGNSVFVVHGRDEELRKSMFAFLRALNLNPLEWAHAVETAKGHNPYVGDILDSAMAKAQAVVVLFSADELAHLKEEFCSREEKRTEGKPQGQPRPNVLFEAGLALGAHPEKTLIVQVGKVRGFSDIAGKHVLRLTNEPARRNELVNRLEKILGNSVNRKGTDWMSSGDFERS